MSVIGPRPALWNQDVLIAEREKYNANDVKPGLTGWAQINGRDELEIPVKAKLDGEYVEKLGIWMDIKCFLGTIGSVLNSDGVVEGGTGEMNKAGILNFVLIPVIGINGAGLATLIGFAVVLFVREKLLKKQNELEISFKRSVIFGVIVIQIIVYYAFPLWESVAIMLMLFLVLLFILRESVFGFVKNIASKVLKK